MRASAIIERVLRDHPESRSSDKELYILVWEQMGFFMSESQKAKFRDLTSSETIRRIRQKLQEQGRYPANDRIKRHRNSRSQEVQQQMPQTKPERVEPLLDRLHPEEVAAAKRIVEPEQTTLI